MESELGVFLLACPNNSNSPIYVLLEVLCLCISVIDYVTIRLVMHTSITLSIYFLSNLSK